VLFGTRHDVRRMLRRSQVNRPNHIHIAVLERDGIVFLKNFVDMTVMCPAVLDKAALAPPCD
jgi:hypothetical protein